MDIDFNFESLGIVQDSVCEKCGASLKNGKDICPRCEGSKIFLESVHVNTNPLRKKMFKLIQDVEDDIPLPAIGEQVRIRTQVSLNMLALLLKVIRSHGEAQSVTIATYSFETSSLNALLEIFEAGKISELSLFLSDSTSFRYKNFGEIERKILSLKKKGFNVRLAFATTHLKITLIQCGENYYQIEGSMNYSINNLCEQVSIENCKETYDYDFNLINNIMPAIKSKMLRVVC